MIHAYKNREFSSIGVSLREIAEVLEVSQGGISVLLYLLVLLTTSALEIRSTCFVVERKAKRSLNNETCFLVFGGDSIIFLILNRIPSRGES